MNNVWFRMSFRNKCVLLGMYIWNVIHKAPKRPLELSCLVVCAFCTQRWSKWIPYQSLNNEYTALIQCNRIQNQFSIVEEELFLLDVSRFGVNKTILKQEIDAMYVNLCHMLLPMYNVFPEFCLIFLRKRIKFYM